MDLAIRHHLGLGATDVVKLGKVYDIKLKLDSVERHVEVKGSSLPIETVELTSNEVMHPTDFQPTDLIVVDGIDWARDPSGKVSTSGGRLRAWADWTPLDEDPCGSEVRLLVTGRSRSNVKYCHSQEPS